MADFKDYFAVNKRIDIQVRFMGFTCSIVIAKTLSRCGKFWPWKLFGRSFNFIWLDATNVSFDEVY